MSWRHTLVSIVSTEDGFADISTASPLKVISGANGTGSIKVTGDIDIVSGNITIDGSDNSSNWDTAYGWGDHSVEGYLTSFTESDPIFSAERPHYDSVYSTVSAGSGNWDTAYGWGDHSVVGYLTSFTETDPIFTAERSHYDSVYSTVSAGSGNWDTAYGWGDHSTQGYDNEHSFKTVDVNDSDSGFTWGSNDIVADTTTDTLKLIAGSNITIESDSANDAIRITSTDTNDDTTYSTSVVDSSNDAIIRLTGSDSTTDDVKLVAGGNITLTPNNDDITIAATDTNDDTTYSISVEDGDNSDEEKIRLTAGGSGSGTDDIVLEAGTGLSIGRSGDKITFTNTVTDTDTDTTYSISCSDGENSDEEKIVLTAGGSGSGTDEIVLEAGTGLSIARSSDKITFTNTVTDTDTTYSAGALLDLNSTTFNVDLTEATEAAVTVADDYILFLDGGATGSHAKESIADFIAAIAGTNLTASNGVLNAAGSSGGEANEHSFKTIDINDSDSGFTWGSNDIVADTTTDTLKLIAGSNITIESDANNDAIRITSTDTNTNTTYTIGAVDSNNDAIIRLTDSNSTTDDVKLVAGSNITLTPSNDNITIAATDTDTTYTAGNGLVLNSTTFKLDDPANGTTIDESTIVGADRMLIWDESDSSWKYVTVEDLQDEIDTTGGGGGASSLEDLSDVNSMTEAEGDILYWDNTNSRWTNLAAGSDGQVLKISSGTPAWGTDNTGGGGSSFDSTEIAEASGEWNTTWMTVTANSGHWVRAKDHNKLSTLWFAGTGNDNSNAIQSWYGNANIDDFFIGGGTASIWIKPDTLGQNEGGRIIDRYGTDGWYIAMYGTENANNDGYIEFKYSFNNTDGIWRTTNKDIILDEWSHVAITYNGGSHIYDPIFYINGVAVDVTEHQTPGGLSATDTTNSFGLGNHYAAQNYEFGGEMTDIKLANRILTEKQIHDLYRGYHLDYSDRWGDKDNITAGSLSQGKRYRIVDNGSADWTNVGAPNNNIGTEFISTGGTPTTWTDGVLKQVGLVAEWKPEGIGSLSKASYDDWIDCSPYGQQLQLNYVTRTSSTILGRYVGIGESDPQASLHVAAASASEGIPLMVDTNDTAAGAGIRLATHGSQKFAINLPYGDNHHPTFYDKIGGSWTAAITLTGGKVGMGTLYPDAQLHVAGDMHLTGDFYDRGNSSGSTDQVLKKHSSGGLYWADESGGGGGGGGSTDTDWTSAGSDNLIYNESTKVVVGQSTSDVGYGGLQVMSETYMVSGVRVGAVSTGLYDSGNWGSGGSGYVVNFKREPIHHIYVQGSSGSGHLTFSSQSQNIAAGRMQTFKITNNASIVDFTFSSSWVFIGEKPSSMPAGKTAVLTLLCTSTSESDIIATYSVQD